MLNHRKPTADEVRMVRQIRGLMDGCKLNRGELKHMIDALRTGWRIDKMTAGGRSVGWIRICVRRGVASLGYHFSSDKVAAQLRKCDDERQYVDPAVQAAMNMLLAG